MFFVISFFFFWDQGLIWSVWVLFQIIHKKPSWRRVILFRVPVQKKNLLPVELLFLLILLAFFCDLGFVPLLTCKVLLLENALFWDIWVLFQIKPKKVFIPIRSRSPLFRRESMLWAPKFRWNFKKCKPIFIFTIYNNPFWNGSSGVLLFHLSDVKRWACSFI